MPRAWIELVPSLRSEPGKPNRDVDWQMLAARRLVCSAFDLPCPTARCTEQTRCTPQRHELETPAELDIALHGGTAAASSPNPVVTWALLHVMYVVSGEHHMVHMALKSGCGQLVCGLAPLPSSRADG